MPGPSVRSPVDEFRRCRRKSGDDGAPVSGRMAERGRGFEPDAADPNQAAREKWRQDTADALRQLPPVPRLDQD